MARPNSNENYLLLSATAPHLRSPLLVVTRRIADAGCHIVESRLASLGEDVVLNVLVVGSWDAVAKLETAAGRMEREDSLRIQTQRTQAKPTQSNLLPYLVEVVAADKPGILIQIAEFFAARGIQIESLSSSRYRAMQTGAEMFQAQLTIGIPGKTHLAGLRDEFLEFCDSMNLDAILDPVKF